MPNHKQQNDYLFFDLLKVSKVSTKFFDLFKVSKMTNKFLTCSKSAKYPISF